MEIKKLIQFLEDKIYYWEVTTSTLSKKILDSDNKLAVEIYKDIIKLLQSGEKLKREMKKEIKDWRKIAKSGEIPKLPGEGFEKGWKLAINRVCNSIEEMIK